MAEESIEKFQPTNGRVVGVLGLVAVLALMTLGAIDGYPVWAVGLLAVVAVMTWAAVLRPGVRIVGDDLELRNMFVTQSVPLGAIEEVAVRRVLAIRAGDRRFVSPAISRSLRQTLRPKKGDQPVPAYPDFVEGRIRAAAADHRDRVGIRARSDEQDALAHDVRSDPAWPELGALAVAVLILLVGVVLAL
jgi:hypothetical protein